MLKRIQKIVKKIIQFNRVPFNRVRLIHRQLGKKVFSKEL